MLRTGLPAGSVVALRLGKYAVSVDARDFDPASTLDIDWRLRVLAGGVNRRGEAVAATGPADDGLSGTRTNDDIADLNPILAKRDLAAVAVTDKAPVDSAG